MPSSRAGTPSPWLSAVDEIAATLARIDEAEFAAVAAEFADPSKRWFFSGQGRSGLVARMIAMRAMHIGRQAHFLGEPTCPSVGAGDGVVFLSGSGETPVTVHYAGIARGVGATVVAVTHDGASTLAGLADRVLVVPAAGSVQLSGNLSEQCSLIVLDALIGAIASGLDDPEGTLARRHTNMQ